MRVYSRDHRVRLFLHAPGHRSCCPPSLLSRG